MDGMVGKGREKIPCLSDGSGGWRGQYSREYSGYRELVRQVLSEFFFFGREKMKIVGGAGGFVGRRFFVVVRVGF